MDGMSASFVSLAYAALEPSNVSFADLRARTAAAVHTRASRAGDHGARAGDAGERLDRAPLRLNVSGTRLSGAGSQASLPAWTARCRGRDGGARNIELNGAGERILRELREATGRTVGLAVLDGTEVLYLQRLCGFQRGEYRLERGWGAGSRRAAQGTAAGRALLAALAESESGGAGEQEPSRIQVPTGELTVDEGALRGRARGLAIAVPGGDGRTGAIEITVPGEAMGVAELLAELGERLREAAGALEGALAGVSAEELEERVAGLES